MEEEEILAVVEPLLHRYHNSNNKDGGAPHQSTRKQGIAAAEIVPLLMALKMNEVN